MILTPPEVVTVNSLLTGKTTGSYLNFTFERGLVRYRFLITASIGRVVLKLLDIAPKFSACFYTASTNSRAWKRLVAGRTFEGSDSQPGS